MKLIEWQILIKQKINLNVIFKLIQNQSKKHEFPFDHWEYNNALI